MIERTTLGACWDELAGGDRFAALPLNLVGVVEATFNFGATCALQLAAHALDQAGGDSSALRPLQAEMMQRVLDGDADVAARAHSARAHQAAAPAASGLT